MASHVHQTGLSPSGACAVWLGRVEQNPLLLALSSKWYCQRIGSKMSSYPCLVKFTFDLPPTDINTSFLIICLPELFWFGWQKLIRGNLILPSGHLPTLTLKSGIRYNCQWGYWKNSQMSFRIHHSSTTEHILCWNNSKLHWHHCDAFFSFLRRNLNHADGTWQAIK